MVVKRFEVYLINLDPTIGSEIKKTRPCLIVSPDEMNRHIATVIVAPMTTHGKAYPTRVICVFQGSISSLALLIPAPELEISWSSRFFCLMTL